MSGTYEPGAIALIHITHTPTVARLGGAEHHAVRGAHPKPGCWALLADTDEFLPDSLGWVEVVRPLVVLDLDPTVITENLGARRNEAQRLVDMLRETADQFFTPDAAALARKVADQIEAQTKPPHIPEPGLWGVVEATGAGLPRRRWIRHEEDRWVCDTGLWRYWADLRDPVLVRDGIEDGA